MADKDPSGKAEWLRSVLEHYEGPLIRYAARITGDLERARDVVQETFLRLCGTTPQWVEEHLAEWLFTVCRRLALNVKRKEGRMRPLNEKELAGRPGRGPAPDELAERRESSSLVLRLLAQLPENQQEAVRLKFQEGLGYREIGRVMNLSVSNVGFLIHAALKTMREQIGTGHGLVPKA